MAISALNRNTQAPAPAALASDAFVPRVAGAAAGDHGAPTKVSLAGVDPAGAAPGLVWENRTRSTAAGMMAYNISNQPLASRLHGLGGELLRQVAYDGNDFAQTVSLAPSGAASNTYDLLVTPNQVSQHGKGDNQIALSLTLRSGTKVELSLDVNDKSIAIEAHSDAQLNEGERKALGKLADGFQKAIDGLSEDTPRIDLSALIQYDRTAFSAVDFKGQIKLNDKETQNLEFHATSSSRSLSYSGPAGTGKVAVDLSQPASWGSEAQHAKALNHYLQQVDLAGVRGQANGATVTLFKDAFRQLNSDYGDPPPVQQQDIQLTGQDRAFTTGLADFEASFAQADSSPNPARVTEKDSFAYQVSQSTKIAGASQLDRSITQSQQSHLQARFHQPVSAEARLALDLSPASQNYKYVTLDDSASSTASISYQKGELKSATLNQASHQNTREAKYVFGKLVSDHTTPRSAVTNLDLTALLAPEQSGLPTLDDQARARLLTVLNNRLLLQADPAMLPGDGVGDGA